MPENDDEDKGPLAFLDRLLDEERDSNLHLGDVRFWQHLEHVKVSLVYRTTSLEYKMMKMMCCEAILYIALLCVFTSFMVMQRSPEIFESRRQQLDYWGGCNRTMDGRVCSIDEVYDHASLMTWLKEDLSPKAFTEQQEYQPIASAVSLFRLQSGAVPWRPRYIGDTKTSILVGAIRIRQLRVQYNLDCSILEDYQDIHKDCFPRYSPGVESRLKWHPVWAPDQVKPHYKHYNANETGQGDVVGAFGVYPGSGFVLDLPLSLTSAITRLEELEEWSWLDVRTRAVIIELSTLNPNVNVMSNVKMLFEFPATGGVYIKQDASSFRALQLSLALAATDDPMGMFAMLIMTESLFMLFLWLVLYVMVKNGSRFFTYFWSCVDVLLLILWHVYLLMYFLGVYSASDQEPNLHPEVLADPEMFFPIGKLVGLLENANTILACLGLLAWLKVLKYFSLSAYFMGFVRVIERCIVNLMLFGALLFLVVFGFAVSLHIGFGADDNLFGSIWGSFISVIVAPAGGVDLEPIFAKGGVLGPVLVFMYIIVVFLLLLNTFMAISVDTYSVCMYEISEVVDATRPNPIRVFLGTYLNAMMGIKLVGKETEEDRGFPHEQEIALTSLPEAIQMRYIEQKRRMQGLLDNVQAQIAEEERKRLEPEQYEVDDEDEDEDEDALALTSGTPQQALEDGDVNKLIVKRVQLQRMLEDDPIMQEICDTNRAVDIIRRFRVDVAGGDPYAQVAELQASIALKLKDLEDKGMDLSFDQMEALKTVSQELHSALTESQKEWRSELLSVLQMASLLSKALIDLTTQLAKVQQNHNALEQKATPK
uniref:Uncharacterized protein n=1 Tax=Zooxanthella nutricula TaxID=1333877 RepID=A0A6U6PXZ4_9DINO|mmetsp:Transcript_62448/g.190968  ORF Transcript_62448/g.190968 Transcript_62448/m.190968 type:complete len:821 (+) Transcript_62448:73-2535(+)